MKALKIIGIVVGGLAVLAAVALIAAGVLVHQVVDLETGHLKQQDYLGPYHGTALTVSRTSSSQRSYTVSYTDARGRAERTKALGLGAPFPKAGDPVDVFVSADDDTDVLVTGHPGMVSLAGQLRVGGYVSGAVGVVLIVGCSVLLATGRRKRLARSGPAGVPGRAPVAPGGPGQSPRQPGYPPQQPYPQQQMSPQQPYPQQQMSQQPYPQQQMPPQRPYPQYPPAYPSQENPQAYPPQSPPQQYPGPPNRPGRPPQQ